MKPPVWRRLVVPSDITLGSLHDVIQVAFGWEGMHLHAFEDRAGGRYAPPEDLDIPVFDEEEAALANVLPGTGDRMDYTYDFGDDWLHRITVEAVRPAREGEGEHTVCAGGRRAMPPAEDLGGVWGLAALSAYPSETDVAAEVAGWLAARPAADAAVQVADACDGTEPADALRRLQAPRVLAAVLEADRTGRAKAVLHKTALSKVTGCAHAAASMLRRIDEPAEREDARGLEWMLVNGALPFVAAGEQLLCEQMLAGPEEGRRPLDQLTERADDLWRAGHPHASEVLGALADAVKPVDKALAKRLRKAAFKAGSVK